MMNHSEQIKIGLIADYSFLEKDAINSLTNVCGIELIKRNILLLQDQGFNQIYVLTRYPVKQIESLVSDRKMLATLTIVNYGFENNSFLNAFLGLKSFFNESFLVLDANYVYDRNIINYCQNTSFEEIACLLCNKLSKENNNSLHYSNTKIIANSDNIITNLGIELTNFNYESCNIALLNTDVFDKIKDYNSNDIFTINDIIKELIKTDKIALADITNFYWINVNSKDAIKVAEKCLIKSLVKPTDGLIDYIIDRRVSLFITKSIMKTSITPNLMTFFTFIFVTIAIYMVIVGDYITALIGGVLFQLGSITDGCDGELARLKYLSSEIGTFLDSVIDDASNSIMAFAVGYHASKVTGSDSFYYFGLYTCCSLLLIKVWQYYKLKKEQNTWEVLNYKYNFEDETHESFKNMLLRFLRKLVKKDFYCFAIMVIAIFNVYSYASVIIFLFAIGISIAFISQEWLKYMEKKSLALRQ